jgi:hypothetical protein
MNRNLKSLALFAGALLTIAGPLASGANAHTPARFALESPTARITAESEDDWRLAVTGNQITCNVATEVGTVTGTSVETITLSPVYEECTAFGFLGAKITGFGNFPEVEGAGPYCDYKIRASGTTDIDCPAGKDVTVDVGSACIIHIPPQTNLGTMVHTTSVELGKHAVTPHVNFPKLTVTHTDLNFLCPFSGSGEVSNASVQDLRRYFAEDPSTNDPVGLTWLSTVP